MDRYRVGLIAVLVVIVGAVLVFGFHVGWSPDGGSSGPSSAPLAGASDPDLLAEGQRPAAPEFTGLDGWLNSPPLTIASLRGQVVLIDFWTYSCVNCVNTLPHLRSMYNQFSSEGFTIVGAHSPEFDFEKSHSNVAAAVKRLNVTWPVALDSNMATWNAWSNQYWPAEYLIDKSGNVAYYHFGEGNYDVTERAVASLLGAGTVIPAATPSPGDPAQTPELYAGSGRGQLDGQEQYGPPSVSKRYTDPGPPSGTGKIEVVGTWADHVQYLESTGAGDVRLRFHANDLYVVAESSGGPITATVTLDGGAVDASHRGPDLSAAGTLVIGRSDLFHVLTGVGGGDHLIDIAVPAGFRLYTFTFE
ncbi:MAG: redoxin family protein [Candidatus Dormibacterales bacterium]